MYSVILSIYLNLNLFHLLFCSILNFGVIAEYVFFFAPLDTNFNL